MESLMSVLTGGASGLLGTGISWMLGHFKKNQDHQHVLDLREMDLQEMRLEVETAERRHALQLEGAVAAADAKAMAASYREAASRWTKGMEPTQGQLWCLVAVDVVRGLMRPVLTVAYTVAAYRVWTAFESPDDSSSAAHAIIYLAVTCATWWFGTRATHKMFHRGDGPSRFKTGD